MGLGCKTVYERVTGGVSMAISLDPKQIVSNDELLMSGSLTRGYYPLACGEGIFTKEEFLKMVNVVNLEIARMV